jgi:hypothetical protein
MLSIAAREADIVSVNFDLASGLVGPQLGASGTAAATAEKLRWVREAAGARFDQLELSATLYWVMVTDDRRSMAAGLGDGFGLTADEVLAMPNFAIGTVDQIADDLVARRERFGFSYVVVGGEAWEAMGPVVDRLGGT